MQTYSVFKIINHNRNVTCARACVCVHGNICRGLSVYRWSRLFRDIMYNIAFYFFLHARFQRDYYRIENHDYSQSSITVRNVCFLRVGTRYIHVIYCVFLISRRHERQSRQASFLGSDVARCNNAPLLQTINRHVIAGSLYWPRCCRYNNMTGTITMFSTTGIPVMVPIFSTALVPPVTAGFILICVDGLMQRVTLSKVVLTASSYY